MLLELDEPHLAHNCTLQAVKATYEFAASCKLGITDQPKILFMQILLRRHTQATTFIIKRDPQRQANV